MAGIVAASAFLLVSILLISSLHVFSHMVSSFGFKLLVSLVAEGSRSSLLFIVVEILGIKSARVWVGISLKMDGPIMLVWLDYLFLVLWFNIVGIVAPRNPKLKWERKAVTFWLSLFNQRSQLEVLLILWEFSHLESCQFFSFHAYLSMYKSWYKQKVFGEKLLQSSKYFLSFFFKNSCSFRKYSLSKWNQNQKKILNICHFHLRSCSLLWKDISGLNDSKTKNRSRIFIQEYIDIDQMSLFLAFSFTLRFFPMPKYIF